MFAQNIAGALDAIIDHIPRKWSNVQALFIKTHNSVALPFFNSLPEITKFEEQV